MRGEERDEAEGLEGGGRGVMWWTRQWTRGVDGGGGRGVVSEDDRRAGGVRRAVCNARCVADGLLRCGTLQRLWRGGRGEAAGDRAG